MNVVMTGSGRFVEIQATAEKSSFDDGQMAALLALAKQGIAELVAGAKASPESAEGIDPGHDHLRRHEQCRQAAGNAAGSLGSGHHWGRHSPLPGLRDLPAPPEDGATFEENARLKALYYSRHSDEPVLAEDSGLEVEALGGAPGVRSARYAGEAATDAENNARLLEELKGVSDRRARFVSVVVLARQGQVLQRGARDRGRPDSRGPARKRGLRIRSVVLLSGLRMCIRRGAGGPQVSGEPPRKRAATFVPQSRSGTLSAP